MSEPVKGWMVVDQYGRLQPFTFSIINKQTAIMYWMHDRGCEGTTWKKLYGRGYRVRPVTITIQKGHR